MIELGYMDREKQKRNQMLKVVITEVIMAVSVVAIVGVLMMVVMGYSVRHDEEWSLEQSGLVQIVSTPAASIELDGEHLMQRTEISRMMSEGEHTIKLTREGYDSWEKKINVRPGYFLRLKYPRLFRNDLTAEEALTLPENVDIKTFSVDRNSLLYTVTDSTVWHVISLRNDSLTETEIDVKDIVNGPIEEMRWAQSGEKILVRVSDENTEWISVNLKDVSKSINLTKEFGLNFSEIKAVNDVADKLWVIENGNLREVNLSSKEISGVLVSKVLSFANDKEKVVYVTETDEGREIGTYREGDSGSVTVKKIDNKDVQVMVTLEDYLGDYYLGYTVGQKMYIYKSVDFPVAEQKFKMEKVLESELKVLPGDLQASLNGQFMVLKTGIEMAVFDAETEAIYEYALDNPDCFWVDDYLVGNIVEGTLYVRDFDGTNVRKVATAAGAPAVISANQKYLYYFTNEKNALMRERL